MSLTSLVHQEFQNLPELFQAITACLGEGLYVVDSAGKVLYINTKAEATLGYEAGTLSNQPIHELIQPQFINGTPLAMPDTTGIQDHSPQQTEALFTCQDGSLLPVIFTATPLLHEGQIKGIIIVFRDTLQQKQTESLLRENEDRYHQRYTWMKKTVQAIQRIREPEHIPDVFKAFVEQAAHHLNLDRSVIFTFTPDGQPCPVEYEYLSDQALGSFVGMLPPWETCPFLRQCDETRELALVEDVQETPYWQDDFWRGFYQAFHIRGGGAIAIRYKQDLLCVFIFHTQTPKVWGEQECLFIESIAEQASITLFRMRATQLLEQANQRKSQFIAIMSHELRTPLNAVLGYGQMLENGLGGPLNEKQKKYIHNIVSNGKHLLDMVNEILDLAKIENGKVTLRLEQIPLAQLMAEKQTTFESLLQQKNIQFTLVIAPELSYIQADPVRIRQVLMNLLSNAIKFNREGGEIHVHWTQSEDRQWTLCQVKDTGCGIPANELPEIFSDFYQVDTTAARLHQGTGLGLAVTRRLIELHGGTISIESEEGNGATFTFRLPNAL